VIDGRIWWLEVGQNVLIFLLIENIMKLKVKNLSVSLDAKI
jgi:hypothetical protein